MIVFTIIGMIAVAIPVIVGIVCLLAVARDWYCAWMCADPEEIVEMERGPE